MTQAPLESELAKPEARRDWWQRRYTFVGTAVGMAFLLLSMAGAALYPVLLLGSGGVTVAEVREALRRKPGVSTAPPADLL